MTRNSSVVVLAALAALGQGCATATSTQVDLDQLLATRWGERYPGRPGGLTLVAIGPRGAWFSTTVAGVTRDSRFRAASTTKTLTAAAIVLLDQRGLLRLDDALTAPMPGRSEPYLPDTADFAIPNRGTITLRLLLQHRAGVWDANNDAVPFLGGASYIRWKMDQEPTHTFTVDELVGFVAAHGLSKGAPGASYHYSDTGYAMLGRIVERVSGLRLDAFVTAEFLAPAGITRTRFVTSGTDNVLEEPLIPGFSLAEGTVFPAGDANLSYDVGSGNMITTPSDLATWIRSLLGGGAGIDAAHLARMEECIPTGVGTAAYGLGLSCNPPSLGYGHNGGMNGYLTMARHDPANGFTVVLLASLIDFDDPAGETAWLVDVATGVRRVIGL